MRIFIDTNILLSFYHLSSDDLEELKKLAVLLKQGTATLYVTEQVAEEFARNRESKIADAVKKLEEQRLNLQFPQVYKDFQEYKELRKLQQSYDNAHSQLLDKVRAAAQNSALKADLAVAELFGAATNVPRTPEAVVQARFRMEVGNPPGKSGSLGDALNWELLLATVPNGEDIFFVSEDRDFVSILDKSKFNDFLASEWSKKKSGQVRFYKQLSSFFKEKFPHIELASELEKDLAIKDLANSPNFASTHSMIAKLAKFGEFTTEQAAAILTATTTNNQVGWIASDTDVQTFLRSILKDHKSLLDPLLVNEIKELMKEDELPD